MSNIPLGLKVNGAEYSVLRVFASLPGEAKLERTLEWDEDVGNVKDPDGHPLATLHLANFKEGGEKLDEIWEETWNKS